MKHILPIISACLLYATALQSAEALEEKINIVNKVGITTPIIVRLKQEGKPETQKPVKIIKSSDKLFYDPKGRTVTITYKIKDEWFTKTFEPEQLNDKELRIMAPDDIRPEIKPLIAPKKQPIKVAIIRPSVKDTIKNYSVEIKDSTGDPITTSSTFKENTDYVLKKPYLRLNKHESDAPFWRRYNKNKIILTGNYINGTKQAVGTVTVTAKDVPEGFEINFWDSKVEVVNPKTKTVKTSLNFE